MVGFVHLNVRETSAKWYEHSETSENEYKTTVVKTFLFIKFAFRGMYTVQNITKLPPVKLSSGSGQILPNPPKSFICGYVCNVCNYDPDTAAKISIKNIAESSPSTQFF